jgi:hypothetical protein
MPISQFKPPRLKENGDLEVRGPFTLEFDAKWLVGDVVISFLIVQDVDGHPPILINGVATWRPERGPDWHATIPAAKMTRQLTTADDPPDPANPRKGRCRGIGQAIVFRQPEPAAEADPANPDPPIFDSFTWCVTTKVVPELRPTGAY